MFSRSSKHSRQLIAEFRAQDYVIVIALIRPFNSVYYFLFGLFSVL